MLDALTGPSTAQSDILYCASFSGAARASAAYSDLTGLLSVLRGQGLSLRAIAADLNDRGHETRSGKPWSAMQVSRVLAIIEQL